ncbi:MAG: hypothetical protein IPG22_19535 [Acidobacteria bacterium]|nr:hypothetical protein [Acidobacteriota bacterium]
MLKEYEKTVIKVLTADVLSPSQISDVLEKGELLSYEYTGSGYFLKIIHPSLPDHRIVCDSPILGKADDILCGFIVFIENRSLLLECHSWSEPSVPEDFRQRNVLIDLLPL